MPKRGKLILVACEPCRRRKVRCDGLRPECGACKDKDARCTYGAQPGVTRSAALKSEVSELRSGYSDLIEMYWQLKHGNLDDAWTLVKDIRSGRKVYDLPSVQSYDQLYSRPPSTDLSGPPLMTRMGSGNDEAPTTRTPLGSTSSKSHSLARPGIPSSRSFVTASAADKVDRKNTTADFEVTSSPMKRIAKRHQMEGTPSSHRGFASEDVVMAVDDSLVMGLEDQPYQPEYGIASPQCYYQNILPAAPQTDWTSQQPSSQQFWSDANIDPALRAHNHAGALASLSSNQRLQDDPC